MPTLKKSPFKVNMIENDPLAFGLRVHDTMSCAEALYNHRSILITGPRGIGKSSLGSQVQFALSGDHTLLKRSGITTKLPRHLIAFFACDKSNTLADLAHDLLFTLEEQTRATHIFADVSIKPTFEVNLGVFKTSLEAEAKNPKHAPSTIATQFVAGLNEVLRNIEGLFTSPGINIMLDEVDRLDPSINFGHFMKVLHETLHRTAIRPVTFILAGQQGTYSRLISDDPSFERVVRHVPLSTLNRDSAEYIIQYASTKASPEISVSEDAYDLILGLASGYPYVIHLLGDSAFMHARTPERMDAIDVLNGLETVLGSDKREKYLGQLKNLDKKQRTVIMKLAEMRSETIPVEIPIDWLYGRLDAYPEIQSRLDDFLLSIEEKGYIRTRSNRTIVNFTEELFRVFIALGMIEQYELRIRRSQRDASERYERKYVDEFMASIYANEWEDVNELPLNARKSIVRKVKHIIATSEISPDHWMKDDLYDIFDDYISLPPDILLTDDDDPSNDIFQVD